MTADRVALCIAFFLIGVLLARSVFLQWRLARVEREAEMRDANLMNTVSKQGQWLSRLDDAAAIAFLERGRPNPRTRRGEDHHAGRN